MSPGTAVTGFPPGTSGTVHAGDAVAAAAQTDLTAAYNNAAGQPPTTTGLSGIANQTLTPGVYNASSSLLVNGTVTLDGQGNQNAVFIFQIGSTLTTASASDIELIAMAPRHATSSGKWAVPRRSEPPPRSPAASLPRPRSQLRPATLSPEAC